MQRSIGMNYDARKLDPNAKEALRSRVAHAVVDDGMSQAEAVGTFHVGRTAVHHWTRAYRQGGDAALRTRPLGRPKRSRLAGHQAAAVVNHITDRTPDQLKLPFVLWTRQAVQQLIAERFGIEVSVWTVGRYLKRWGFTPQKPVRRAYEQDPQAVERWLTETYPKIKARAKREKGEIHWGDEMGLRSDHQTGTTYAPRGKTPVIAGTGQRFGCNMISTITNQGTLRFMVFRRRFTADVMIEFLGRLVRQAGRKVLLILDGHPVHRSRKVKNWVAKRRRQIELFNLPGYSPQLNPDELLNQDVKSNALGRRRPTDQAEMIAEVRSYLRGTQRQPAIVRSYFQEQHVRYAAER
jgi:transposase